MNDLKFAFRQLLKNPVISCIAILTLALGIGANTAIFSVMNALMLRMLPVADPARLVLFGNGDSLGSTDGFPNGSTTLFPTQCFANYSGTIRFSQKSRRSKACPLPCMAVLREGRNWRKCKFGWFRGAISQYWGWCRNKAV